MDKAIFIIYGILIGFLTNSILHRIAGHVSDEGIHFPIAMLILTVVMLTARLLVRSNHDGH